MLVFSESGDSEPYITPAGFQFLLLDTSSQIWYFMLQYLQTVEVRRDCIFFVAPLLSASNYIIYQLDFTLQQKLLCIV